MTDNKTNNPDAKLIVSSYGKLLADAIPVFYGLPFSDLPFSKIQIKDAIQTLILDSDPDNENLLQGLIQGYVSLAQFVTDDELTTLKSGMAAIDLENPEDEDYQALEQASFITSKIKADMENNVEELQLLLGKKIKLN